MDSNKLNMIIETGTDFMLSFTLRDDNDDPIDLTGATIKSTLREFPESPDYYDFAVSHNNTGGKITVQMSHALTAMIPYSYGVWDVKIKNKNGKISRPLYGDVYIRPGITMEFDGNIYFIIGFDNFSQFPYPGNPNYIYLDRNTGKVYIWDGDHYREISIKLQMHPTFSVNVDNGHLYMHTEDDYRFPDFVLSDDSGHFSVIYEN